MSITLETLRDYPVFVMTTTMSAFLSQIAASPQAPLVFNAEGTDIRPEYHVTEVKLAHIRALDCGRGAAEWDETVAQLLDGPPARMGALT